MGTSLVTGATGLIGTHLVRALSDRGDSLRLLLRRTSDAGHLSDLDFERHTGDVTDRRAVRRAIEGVDRVFHLAGQTTMRSEASEEVFATNVGGARVVAEEALEAGVGRVIHTSSAVAIGPAEPGGRADERNHFDAFAAASIPYVLSKHESEGEMLRVAAHGLEVVIVNPTFVVGPGPRGGSSMELIKRLLSRQIPAYVDGGINVSDARDVAAGHLLADEKGEPGERYILGGRNFTVKRLFADVARISGVPAPPLRLPQPLALGLAASAERIDLGLPISPDETRSAAMWWTYSAAKAKRELGYSPRPHEETLSDAIAWQAEQLANGEGLDSPPPAVRLASVVGGAIRLAGRLLP